MKKFKRTYIRSEYKNRDKHFFVNFANNFLRLIFVEEFLSLLHKVISTVSLVKTLSEKLDLYMMTEWERPLINFIVMFLTFPGKSPNKRKSKKNKRHLVNDSLHNIES